MTHTETHSERQKGLPRTFDEVARREGHSVEDFAMSINFDEDKDAYDAAHHNYDIVADEKDLAFYRDPAALTAYDQSIGVFIHQKTKENPYPQRPISHAQIGWTAIDSKAYAKSRAEASGSRDIHGRIYLNPANAEVFTIYKEIFDRAESEGLRFKSKVFDLQIRNSPDPKISLQRWAQYGRVRSDPILFYVYKDSKDAMVTIVNDVYEKHRDAFTDRRLPVFPYQVAPGYGIGSEPHGLSGEESLSSHRAGRIRSLAQQLGSRLPEWEKLSNIERQHIFAQYFRRFIAPKHHIDPDNIAFNR